MGRLTKGLLLALALTACDPPDVVLAVVGQVPSALVKPELLAATDANGHLRWEARRMPPVDPGHQYVLWLADGNWTQAGWTYLGVLPIHTDGSGSGWLLPSSVGRTSFAGERRPLAVSIEDRVRPDNPSRTVPFWIGAFPAYGEPPASFGFGDAIAGARLEDLVSTTGDLTDTLKGLARFEVYYQKDVVKTRLWNFKPPLPRYQYVVWVFDGGTYHPIGTLTEMPVLPATPIADIPAFKDTTSEFARELTYDEVGVPYYALKQFVITYELKRAAAPTSTRTPAGVVVLSASALAQDALSGGTEGGGHNH